MRVENGDLGLYLWGCVFCSVEGLELADAPEPRGTEAGHRGVWLEHGSDTLMRE